MAVVAPTPASAARTTSGGPAGGPVVDPLAFRPDQEQLVERFLRPQQRLRALDSGDLAVVDETHLDPVVPGDRDPALTLAEMGLVGARSDLAATSDAERRLTVLDAHDIQQRTDQAIAAKAAEQEAAAAKVRAGGKDDELKALLAQRTQLSQMLSQDQQILENPGEKPKLDVSMKVVIILGIFNVQVLAAYVIYKGVQAYMKKRELSAKTALVEANKTAHEAQLAKNEGNTQQLQDLVDAVRGAEKQAKDAVDRFHTVAANPARIITVAANQTPEDAIRKALELQRDGARDAAAPILWSLPFSRRSK